MRLAARRAAVGAATAAKRQLLAMITTAPDPVRARFRATTTRAAITNRCPAAPGRQQGDVEMVTVLTVLHDLGVVPTDVVDARRGGGPPGEVMGV